MRLSSLLTPSIFLVILCGGVLLHTPCAKADTEEIPATTTSTIAPEGDATATTAPSGEDIPITTSEEASTTATPEAKEEEPLNDVPPLETLSAEQQEEMKKSSEAHEFQAEVNRLMDIIINSLYTHKEVFLRELISNAADALEKARFLSVQADTNVEGTIPLEIRVDFDKEAKTITILDTGVGMTKQDLINNLGTVAKSGTSNFLEAIAQGAAGDANLIGQFGVGFYSSFLVADRVTVVSKHTDDDQHVWASSADASFTVSADPRGNTMTRGTAIILHMKEDATEFVDEHRLSALIQKFNQFVSFPIYLRTEKQKTKEIPNPDYVEGSEDSKDEKKAEEDEVDVKSEDEADEKPKKEKPAKTIETTIKYHDWELVNKQKAIWLRSKDEITEAEYNEFYKSLAYDPNDPLGYIHFNAEGEVDFKSLLYIPETLLPGMDFSSSKQDNIKIYARRVLIGSDAIRVLPKWLGFVKGIVDSDDLPLKVDRESLSQTRVVDLIGKKLLRKFLEMVKKLSKEDLETKEKENAAIKEAKEKIANGEKDVVVPGRNQTKFDKFYKAFSKNLKFGCVEDNSDREKLAKLFRYQSSKTKDDETITLDQYVERMAENQTEIFYMASEHYKTAVDSPYMQMYKKKNIEVIILTQALDEPCFLRLTTYNSKKLVSIDKADAKTSQSEDEKARHKKLVKIFKPLTEYWGKRLRKRIGRVQISLKLVEDPVIVANDKYTPSAFGERVYRSQTYGLAEDELKNVMKSRVLEINPDHTIIQKMLEMAKAKAAKTSTKEENKQLDTLAEILLESAVVSGGYQIEDPATYARKVFKLLIREAGVDEELKPETYDITDEDEEAIAAREASKEGAVDNVMDTLRESMAESGQNFNIKTGDEMFADMKGDDGDDEEGEGSMGEGKIIDLKAGESFTLDSDGNQVEVGGAGVKEAEERKEVPDEKESKTEHDEL